MKKNKENRLSELKGIILFFVAIILFLTLATYNPDDVGNRYPDNPLMSNYLGIVGAWVAYWLYFTLGFGSYLIPLLVMGGSFSCLFSSRTSRIGSRFVVKLLLSLVLLLATITLLDIQSLIDTSPILETYNITSFGGRLGEFIASVFIRFFSSRGATTILLTVVVLSVFVITELRLIPTVTAVARMAQRAAGGLVRIVSVIYHFLQQWLAQRAVVQPKTPVKRKTRKISVEGEKRKRVVSQDEDAGREVVVPRSAAAPSPQSMEVAHAVDTDVHYVLPSIDLLNDPPPVNKRELIGDLDRNSEVLETTLKEFGISIKVVEVVRGPVITRYEVQLAPGTKVQRISSLLDDIALAMKAFSVRIVAPIPGKAVVGIEVPNNSSSFVYLKEVLGSAEMKKSQARLPLPIGKDVSGKPVVTDLTEMPHLLIAGATGSGKSVCLNAIITSLLFHKTPKELKFLLIDPKKVEFSLYNSLPHLLYPVITDAKKVSLALGWVIAEMERRYELFAKKGVRNIDMYNNGIPSDDPEIPSFLPYIIIIIDELADLMLICPVEVENNIARLAQLARAVGIHMILATQRPSVDVITGIIKANFPARISFQVATRVDSRTVLDSNGAEKLLGNGDLLFLPPTTSKLIRAQGNFLSDEEIERVILFVGSQMEPVFDETILEQERFKEDRVGVADDELFDEAVKVILQTHQASASVLQRRLRIGYARAGRLIDLMEERGIVGPHKGSKPRDIIIDPHVGVDVTGSEDCES